MDASFNTANAFLVGDVKRDATAGTYELRLAVREYGQLSIVLTDAMVAGSQGSVPIMDGELGYPLADFVGQATVRGSFTRTRRTPTSPMALVFNVSALES